MLQTLTLISLFTASFAFATDTSTRTITDSTGYEWRVNVLESGSGWSRPTFFLPHSNERTAYTVSTEYIERYGGWIFAVDCDGSRECDGKDPNRMFNDRAFADNIFRMVLGRTGRSVVTLHNNTDGGELQVRAERGRNGEKIRGVGGAWQRHYYFAGDRDDFVVIIGRDDQPSGKNAQFLRRMENSRINVIYEIYTGENDGSMSYAAAARGLFYVNIEAQHGHTEEQRFALNEVVDFMNGR